MRLEVSHNRRFLVDEDGAPFFYLGDTAWELLYRLTRDEARQYLADRAAKKFSVIQAVLLSEFGALAQPNQEGRVPLRGGDPTTPDEGFFDFVDFVVDAAAAQGLFMGLLPTWADKVGPKLWGTGPEVFTPENARVYGEFLGRRYRDKPIIWILGGDRPVETGAQFATWRALAAGLKGGDGGRHLRTFHPMGGRPSSEFFQDDDWLDFNMIQTSHGARDAATYETVRRDYDRRPVKPTMEGEYCYENHPVDWKPEQGRFDDYDVRKGAYWSLFAGGHGFTYGCNDVFQFFRSASDLATYGQFHACLPWQEALQLPGAGQMRHARALLLSRPFLTRIPDQSLIVGDPGTGTDHVQATRDADGRYALVYTASGKPLAVDLSRLSGGTVRAFWYDPRQGTASLIGEFANTRAAREFTPPSSGYGSDWVLVLDDAAQGFPSPGDVDGP